MAARPLTILNDYAIGYRRSRPAKLSPDRDYSNRLRRVLLFGLRWSGQRVGAGGVDSFSWSYVGIFFGFYNAFERNNELLKLFRRVKRGVMY
jgi:hypothetical protein